MRKLLSISFIIALAATAGRSQTAFSLQSDNGHTSNAFANYQTLPDYYTALNAVAQHDWLGEAAGIRLYYDGAYTAFSRYAERNHHAHELGLAWYHGWGEAENRIDAGLNIGKRFHTGSYQWYEQEQVQAYATLKYVVSPQWFAYFGWSWDLRSYVNLAPFTHSRSLFYSRSSWFFATGTTLIIEGDLMSKRYGSAQTSVSALPDVYTTGDGSSVQGLLSLRAAQGLSRRIGVSGEYQLRRNLSTTTRYIGNSEGFYYSDEELFEDVFAYHGDALLLNYRQELPWAMRLTLSGRREHRAFDNRPAANLLGEPFADGRLRDDRRTVYTIEWQKRLVLKSGWSPLTLNLTWSSLKNGSNDPYYDYRSNFWGAGLSHSF